MAVIDDPEKWAQIARMYADEMTKYITSELIMPRFMFPHMIPPSLRKTTIKFETLASIARHNMNARRARRRRRRR